MKPPNPVIFPEWSRDPGLRSPQEQSFSSKELITMRWVFSPSSNRISKTFQLSFGKDDIITITQQQEGGWWEGTHEGVTGWFPSAYVTLITEKGTHFLRFGFFSWKSFSDKLQRSRSVPNATARGKKRWRTFRTKTCSRSRCHRSSTRLSVGGAQTIHRARDGIRQKLAQDAAITAYTNRNSTCVSFSKLFHKSSEGFWRTKGITTKNERQWGFVGRITVLARRMLTKPASLI